MAVRCVPSVTGGSGEIPPTPMTLFPAFISGGDVFGDVSSSKRDVKRLTGLEIQWLHLE